ncbi:PD-(D/E)XK motif protein [Mucilaginibacter sp. MD40]|uniref:PD-(D/E)XK motif protein n=1 Tax=Mucilaginibacter sp. MD40 TaxID=2029590 RepID=UPI0013046227|nr:PD-(D/E)XK motif protein [Mucilaginibacter sp. MD40]
MTDQVTPPWLSMHSDSQRRVAGVRHDIFWIKDYQGKYGLMLRFSADQHGFAEKIRLRGLTLVEHLADTALELYLILNDSNDGELFTALCGDLISASAVAVLPGQLAGIIIGRLKQWQRFLSESSAVTMTEQLQMGLFSELLVLCRELAPRIGIKNALKSWTGPDFDKKDFSAANSFIEVKSVISSKAPFAVISSIHQLDTATKPLYLAVCNLTKSDSGASLQDMVSAVRDLIGSDTALLDQLNNQTAAYGYTEGITQPPFFKWLTDMLSVYHVREDFPKITSAAISPEIIDASYRIDLSLCGRFLAEFNEIDI